MAVLNRFDQQAARWMSVKVTSLMGNDGLGLWIGLWTDVREETLSKVWAMGLRPERIGARPLGHKFRELRNASVGIETSWS